MNQKTRLLTLCLSLLIVNGCSQTPPRTYTPPGGEFSFVPPENWTMTQVPGFKYQFAFGERENDFTSNINFVDGDSPFKLDDFVTGNLQAMQQAAAQESRSLKILNQGEFTTDARQSGARVVTETEYNGKPVRQTFYFFAGKDQNKFVITCSVPAAGSKDYGKICDSSIRTFQTSHD